MIESKPMHQDLLPALQHLIPRSVYQDSRRLNTLVWAITGLCLTQTVRLCAWGEALESRSQNAARRVRRFSRWLHHPAISPPGWYRPVLQAALSDWPADQRLYVALGTTALRPFVLIRASLIYRGRAMPLAWRVMQHQSTTVAFEDYQPVLEQVRALLPVSSVITLLADRGFVHERLLHDLRRKSWHFRLRLMGKTLVHLATQSVVAVRELAPPAGSHRFFQQIWLLGAAIGPVHLAVARLLERADDPWFVVSDEPTDATTLQEYGLRFDVEESFRDDQSGGFQLHTSRLQAPDALERLLLILALSTLYLTSLGVGLVQAEKRSFVDPHWDRGLSYLQLGVRWRRQQAGRGWPSFAPFRLDPAPDPVPAFASRRAARQSNKVVDLPTAA